MQYQLNVYVGFITRGPHSKNAPGPLYRGKATSYEHELRGYAATRAPPSSVAV